MRTRMPSDVALALESGGGPSAPGPRGAVFDVQRFSLHDGPGIRTTVFLKGCPLRCRWCHNPESWSPRPQLSFDARACIGCGACVEACPHGAHRMSGGCHVLDRAACRSCGRCAEACFAGACELVGREASVDEVLAEVLEDRGFYEDSGGGMTLSGGEPAAQVDFAEALLASARAEGLHTAVETCGVSPPGALERLAAVTDLFLFDIKADPGSHAELTGAPFGTVEAGLRLLHDRGASVRVRVPMIPGVNDRPALFETVARLARELPRLEAFEVLPHHAMGLEKLGRFGLDPPGDIPASAASDAEIDGWLRRLEALGVHALIAR